MVKKTMGTTIHSINVSEEVFKKIVSLKKDRPQDKSRSETVEYLLHFHKEMQEFKPQPRHKIEQVHSKIIVAGEDTP
jgi:predicted CopG family antitoxin